MKLLVCGISVLMTISSVTKAQSNQSIYKLPKELLSGEGLDYIEQLDSTRTVYQKKIYDGKDIAVFMVSIGTGITNEFESFPLEEFIYWMNGKAIVEPKGEEPFAVQTGDYFIQAKGFNGTWSFTDIGGVHLELALVAKNRPDSTFKSPMTKAMILDRDIISGVTQPTNGLVYRGPELTVKVLNKGTELSTSSQERMIHVLNGVLTLRMDNQVENQFFPGDFFIIPEGSEGVWSSSSLQKLRLLEVYKTKNQLK